MDVVIRRISVIFKPVTLKNQTLLIRRDIEVVLNVRLDIANGVGIFHF